MLRGASVSARVRQVVAVSGVNPTGKKFVASGIYTAVPPPAPPEPTSLKHGTEILRQSREDAQWLTESAV